MGVETGGYVTKLVGFPRKYNIINQPSKDTYILKIILTHCVDRNDIPSSSFVYRRICISL